MYRRTFLTFIAALGLLSTSVAWSRSAPIQNIKTPILNKSVTTQEVHDAILRAALSKNWQVVNDANRKITLKYVKKVHVAACDVKYNTKEYSITINPMTTLLRDNNEVHPKYNQWVRNLDKQIQAQLLKK